MVAVALAVALAADIVANGKVTQTVTSAVMKAGGPRISGIRAEKLRADREKAADQAVVE